MTSTIIREFFQTISEKCFSQTTKEKQLREKIFLQWRFNPAYRTKTHIEIAKAMSQESSLQGNFEASINTTVGNVVNAITKTYEQEMKDNEVDTKGLITGKKGCHGAWEKVYDWLWNYQFTHWGKSQYSDWGEDWFLGALAKNANSNGDWITFIPEDKTRIARGGKPREEKMIEVNKYYLMCLNLPYQNHHLLLLNRANGEINCMCPSPEFAPKSELSQEKITIPNNAEYKNLVFETLGKEEFLAIVVDKLLPENCLTSDKIYQFWKDSLEKQKNCQVFYETFEVRKS